MPAFKPIQFGLGGVPFIPGLLNRNKQGVKIIHQERGVCLARGFEIRFNSKMQLHAPCLKPRTAARCKRRGFGDLRKAENVHIKRAGSIFTALGNGKLDMIDRKDHSG